MRTALIPIRDFAGMTRLAPSLEPSDRRAVSIALADRAVTAAASAGLAPVVVTSDPDVTRWAATSAAGIAPDDGSGLSGALRSAARDLGDEPWLILHADLPAIDAEAVRLVARAADDSGGAIAPSLDGGTNLLAASGPFPFSYGPGSFHRHLAAKPDMRVIIDPRLAIELDTPAHAATLLALGLMPSLSP